MILPFLMESAVGKIGNWGELQHAAGAADDVPEALAALTSADAEAREEASTWLIETCLYDENGDFHLHSSSLPVLAALAAFVDADAMDDASEDLQADVADALVDYTAWAHAPGNVSAEAHRAALRKLTAEWPWLGDAQR